MSLNKTVKYHVPQQGLYVYHRTHEGKSSLIVLNSTDSEQVLYTDHYKVLTKGSLQGRDVTSGETVSLQQHLVLSARQSLIIEY